MHLRTGLGALVCALAMSSALAQEPPTPGGASQQPANIHAPLAEALRPIATTPAAHAWLDEVDHLPDFAPRTIYAKRTRQGNAAYTQAEYDELSEDEREGLKAVVCEPGGRYNQTFYGSPLAYLRAIDLGAQHLGTDDEPFELEGARVFDLGYGQIGQLRLLAHAGAHAVGADPDVILDAMYAQPGDTGEVPREEGPPGSVTLTHELWPADEGAREAVGGSFDLIIARNLIKRGYISPPQETPAYTQVSFGVSDDEFLSALYGALRPGGVLVIYTLGGAYSPPGEQYNPAADIANPWDEGTWEAAGFEIIAHEAPESDQARAVGVALGWGSMEELEQAIFGNCSIYRRPE